MSAEKALVEKQLAIIKNLPPGKTHPFTIEGASILEAFSAARMKRSDISAPERALHQKIHTVLGLWHQNHSDAPQKSRGNGTEQRTQHVLRSAIDKVQNGAFSDITAEDVKLLYATQALLKKRNETGGTPNEHLDKVLAKTISALQEHKEKITEVSDQSLFDTESPTSHISPTPDVVHEVMADDIFKDVSLSSLTLVEGVKLDLTIRSVEFTGETSVSGDIPKDAMVKVIDGGLTINGFVTGYAVAEGNITINGNIQGGGAISNTGTIRVERSLMNSTLVAKSGSIVCKHLEAPTTCFAWDTLTVNGPCLGGTVTARNITVNGKVTAATLQSCGAVAVERLEISSRAPTVVYLASNLDCSLYQREMDETASGLVRQIGEDSKSIESAELMDNFTHHMIHTAYRTALFYLLGGIGSASTAIELQGDQTKVLYMSQLIGFTEEYIKFFTEAYATPEEYTKTIIEDFVTSSSESFALIRDDIAAIPEDFGATHRKFLQDFCGEYVFMTQKLRREHEMDSETTFLNKDFKKMLSRWDKALKETKQHAQRLIDSFGLDPKLLARMEHEPEALEGLLNKTLKDMLASTRPDEVQRGKSPLVRLLQTTADRLKRTIEVNNKKIVKCRNQITEAHEELLKERAVIFRDPVPGSCSLSANYYAAEVVITASKLSRKGRDTNMAKVIVLENPIEGRKVFHLWENMIQRQA